MQKIVFATALLFACSNLHAMEQPNHTEQIEAALAGIFAQANQQALSLTQRKDNPPEEWGALLKNAGKLEAALQFNLIADEKAKENIRKGLGEIDAAFEFYVKAQQKMGVLKTALGIAEVLAKHQEENKND